VFNSIFSNISAISCFSGGGSRSTRREPPTLGKQLVNQGMSQGKGMESANNDARKWPISPFDVSRDFIISKEILV
jgi:hypothetical protein